MKLYSKITAKLQFRWNSDNDLTTPENDSVRSATGNADKIILAWGSTGDKNKHVVERKRQILEMMKPYKDKFLKISDGIKAGLHPLTPSVRNQWTLIPYTETEEVQSS